MSVDTYFKNISIQESVENWIDSIVVASKPLLEAGCITQQYVTAMIDNVKTNGSYIVIMPNVALPHSRTENGAIKTGVSILKLEQPVYYPDDKPVQLIISFSANDNNQHMELLSMLAEVLMDQTRLDEILKSHDIKHIEALFFG
jgi:mannitol/fructose-specific phosphotransferase system IIA component (Ntr-type)